MKSPNTSVFLCAILLSLATVDAKAGGLFRSVGKEPTKPPVVTPTPKPTTPKPPAPVTPPSSLLDRPIEFSNPEDENYDLFSEVAHPAMDEVDDQFSSYRALNKVRAGDEEDKLDRCDPVLQGRDTFGERLAYFIYQHAQPRRPHVNVIASYYGLSSNRANYAPVSLTTHPMCNVTKSTLTTTLQKSSRVPAQSVIDKMNTWVNRYNSLRTRSLQGDELAQKDLLALWGKFMGCLSYKESLTTADSSKSHSVSDKYSPSNYRKPAGVKFYEDPYQTEASRLNIGLFQFTPTASGNINACLRHWNELYPSCTVSTSASRADLIRTFGSSFQTMNAFCGVNKIIQSFAIQVNTTKTSSTHPSNKSGSGLKSAGNRCISPFFYSGYTYNHFGPLMNSTGENLNSLMSCALK